MKMNALKLLQGVISFLLAPAIGRMSDRWGRKYFILVASLAAASPAVRGSNVASYQLNLDAVLTDFWSRFVGLRIRHTRR